MSKGDPVNVRKVKNGYIVEPDIRHDNRNYICDDEIIVFNNIEDLNKFLTVHFK